MDRFAVLVLLVLALVWQAVALPGAAATANSAADPAHAALHWQSEGHHHHDDGSSHVDDSVESDRHLMADHAYGAFALLPAIQIAVFHRGSSLVTVASESSAPQPFLDGLLRPPRPVA